MTSERTVENHLRSARKRLGVASTAHAVARVMRLGDIKIRGLAEEKPGL